MPNSKICNHSTHKPPSQKDFEAMMTIVIAGIYENVCEACGKKTNIKIAVSSGKITSYG